MSLRWKRLKPDPKVAALIGDGKVLQTEVVDGHLTVFLTRDDGLLHLSISHRVDLNGRPVPGRNPTWEEIREARYLFCPNEITMAMLLPPQEDYVNQHETTFHLWEVRDQPWAPA